MCDPNSIAVIPLAQGLIAGVYTDLSGQTPTYVDLYPEDCILNQKELGLTYRTGVNSIQSSMYKNEFEIFREGFHLIGDFAEKLGNYVFGDHGHLGEGCTSLHLTYPNGNVVEVKEQDFMKKMSHEADLFRRPLSI